MSSDFALGIIETATQSRGALVTDGLLKTARVDLLFSQPVPPGKLIVAVAGAVAAVEASVQQGLEIAGSLLEDAAFIPRLHPQVVDALRRPAPPGELSALGMIETLTVAAAVRAADAALKSAQVRLLSLRMGRHIGGRAMVHLTGSVADVQAAVDAGVAAIRIDELKVDSAVIPRPHADYAEYMNGGAGVARPLPGILLQQGDSA